MVAAIALHVLLAIALFALLRPSAQRSSAIDFVSTLIIIGSSAAPPHSLPPRRPPAFRGSAPVRPVEPLIAPPTGITPSSPTDTTVDWREEARRAASALAEPGTYRGFSHTPKVEAESRRRPAHEPGEQYRLNSGEWIVWVSEGCYIVSGVPPIGLPDVLARSIPTTTVCRDNSPPPGELFRELPAYEKYHAGSRRQMSPCSANE